MSEWREACLWGCLAGVVFAARTGSGEDGERQERGAARTQSGEDGDTSESGEDGDTSESDEDGESGEDGERRGRRAAGTERGARFILRDPKEGPAVEDGGGRREVRGRGGKGRGGRCTHRREQRGSRSVLQ